MDGALAEITQDYNFGIFEGLLADPYYFLLLMLRISGLIISSPIFGRRNIPNIVKIGYCAVIAGMFYLAIPQAEPLDFNDDILLYILLCIKELLFGIILSFVLNIFFQLVFTSGQMIDMAMGFGMVNVFDVQTNISVPVSANLFNIILTLSFLAVNGHHKILTMLYNSFEQMPIGTMVINPNIGWYAAELFIQTFVLAIIVAMPIISSGLVAEACFGLLMRAVPQMNAFSIGIPVKMVLGFMVLAAMIPTFVAFTNTIFDQMFYGLDQMFNLLTG